MLQRSPNNAMKGATVTCRAIDSTVALGLSTLVMDWLLVKKTNIFHQTYHTSLESAGIPVVTALTVTILLY